MNIEKTNSIQSAENIIITKNFESKFIYMKMFILLYLLVASIYNHDINFIKNNPIIFTIETFLYAIAGTIPFILIMYFRDSKNFKIKNNIITYLCIFFIYIYFNITSQLSGLYTLQYNHDENTENMENIVSQENTMSQENIANKENKEDIEDIEDTNINNKTEIFDGLNISNYITFFIIACMFIIFMFLVSWRVYDFDIYTNKTKMLYLFGEAILFGICNALPFFFIARNRQTVYNNMRNAGETIFTFLLFVILHFILQFTGFYRETLKI